jgi:hypothetical protein
VGELIAMLDRLPAADLNRLRLDTIPRLLRERVAADRAAEFDAYTADYEAQKKAAK